MSARTAGTPCAHLQRELRDEFTARARGSSLGAASLGRGAAAAQQDAAPERAAGARPAKRLADIEQRLAAVGARAAPAARREHRRTSRRRRGAVASRSGLRRHTGATEVCALRSAGSEPLRVAIAGKVKAGKSTLLNALVGEELAPTDAGECTKIVTWYATASTYRVTLRTDGGEPAPDARSRATAARSTSTCGAATRPTTRPLDDRLAVVDAARHDADRHAGHRVAVDRRVGADDDVPHAGRGRRSPPADAVLYLMRHIHCDRHPVPRGVPRRELGPGHADQRGRRAVAGRRDRRGPHSTP